jgi:hypothetical protein
VKRKLPKYTHGYVDQHGKPRFYLRRPGHKKIPLPGLPWSPEFMEAREAALKGEWGKVEIGSRAGINVLVCTENPIRVDDVMESPKLAE